MKWTQVAVLVVWAAVAVAALPNAMALSRFAFMDYGWAANVDAMLDDGLRPVADFGYYYGLLTLLVDRGVFAALGRTPAVVTGLYAAGGLAVAVGVVRVMRAANLSRLPAAYLVVCTPFLANISCYPSPAHALEAALLANALAFHVGRRPGWALALVTAAVFVKPSLGYVYGLYLLVLVLAGWPDGAGRWRRLLPAVGVGTTTLVALVAVFGWEAVVRTQLPFDGMRAYRDLGFGFFRGSGRQFWLPDRPPPLYYLLTVAGLWLLTSVLLVLMAVRLLPRFWQPGANAVAACAVLHAVFVCFLYGHELSWSYYPVPLFVGTALWLNEFLPAEGGPGREPSALARGVGVVLIVLAVLAQLLSVWVNDARGWSQVRRVPDAGGTFATAADAAAWAGARELGRAKPVLVLSTMGNARLLAPELDNPRSWCLMPSLATPGELDRVRAQIAAADYILHPHWRGDELLRWPALADVLAPFRPAGETGLYTLYRRQP